MNESLVQQNEFKCTGDICWVYRSTFLLETNSAYVPNAWRIMIYVACGRQRTNWMVLSEQRHACANTTQHDRNARIQHEELESLVNAECIDSMCQHWILLAIVFRCFRIHIRLGKEVALKKRPGEIPTRLGTKDAKVCHLLLKNSSDD